MSVDGKRRVGPRCSGPCEVESARLTRFGQGIRKEIAKPEFVSLEPCLLSMVGMIQKVQPMNCNDATEL